MDSEGKLLWVKQNSQFNKASYNMMPSISIDPYGVLYIIFVYDAPDYDRNISIFKMSSSGETLMSIDLSDIIVSYYDESRPCMYASTDGVYISYISGGFNHSVTPSTYTGQSDMNVIKLDSDLTHVWTATAENFNTDEYEDMSSIRMDNFGNLYIVYETYGTVPGGDLNYGPNIAVLKLDSSTGKTLWVKQSSSFNIGKNYAPSLCIDVSGNIYVAYVEETDYYHLRVFKMNSSGELQWIYTSNDFKTMRVTPTINIDKLGNLYIIYNMRSDDDVYGNIGMISINSSSGKLTWTKELTTINIIPDYKPSSSIDDVGNIYLAHSTYDILPGMDNVKSGGVDIGIIKFGPS